MMASKLVRPHAQEKSPRVNRWFNSGLDRVARGYSGALAWLVALRPRRIVAGVVLTMLACLAAIYGLARFGPSELPPAEDRGAFSVSLVDHGGARLDYNVEPTKKHGDIFAQRGPGE